MMDYAQITAIARWHLPDFEDRTWIGELIQQTRGRFTEKRDVYVKILDGDVRNPLKLDRQQVPVLKILEMSASGRPGLLVESPLQVRLFCALGWQAIAHPERPEVWCLRPDPWALPTEISEKIARIARHHGRDNPGGLKLFWRELDSFLDELDKRIE